MNNNDLFNEILTQKFSGYIPVLPEDDWVNFQDKLKKKLRKTKLFLNLLNLSLTSSLLILGFWNFTGFGSFYINSQLTNNKANYIENKVNPAHSNNLISTHTKNILDNNFKNKSIQQSQNHFITSNPSLNTVITFHGAKSITSDKNNIPVDKNTSYKNVTTENNVISGNEKETRVDSRVSDNTGINNKSSGTIQPMKKETMLLSRINAYSLIPEKISQQVITNHFKPLFHRPLILFKLVASPSYTFGSYKTKAGSDSLIHENYKEIRDKSEKGGFSLSGGLNIECYLNKRLSVTSGLIYNSFRITGKYDFTNNKIPVVDSATKKIVGYITINDTIGTHFKIDNKYNFIEVPVIITYRAFKFKRLSFDLKTGGNFMYLLSSDEKILNPTKLKIQDISGDHFNKTNWSLMAGLSCTYDINGIISVGFEPMWRKIVDPLFKKDEIINLYPWSVSMNISLMLKF